MSSPQLYLFIYMHVAPYGRGNPRNVKGRQFLHWLIPHVTETGNFQTLELGQETGEKQKKDEMNKQTIPATHIHDQLLN